MISQGAISKTWTAIEIPQLGQMSQRILSPDMLYTDVHCIYISIDFLLLISTCDRSALCGQQYTYYGHLYTYLSGVPVLHD